MRTREAGFTLIELLISVIIIGIMAAIAIPIFISLQGSSHSGSDSCVVNVTTHECSR